MNTESLKENRKFSVAILIVSILVIIPLMVYTLKYSQLNRGVRQQIYSLAAYTLLVVSAFVLIAVWASQYLKKVNARRKATELELRKVKDVLAVKEARYRNLVENSGLIMFTTSMEGIFTFVSDKAVELTGYSLFELKGMHFSHLVSSDTKKSILETYHKQFAENIEETVIDFCITTKDGISKCVEQSAVLIKHNNTAVGLQCTVKDISERKDMETVLKKYEMLLIQNQDRLQSILDNATSMIYIKDLTGKYVLINKRFKEVFNLSDEEIIGKTDYDFANPEQAKRFSETDEQVLTTGLALELEEVLTFGSELHTVLITKFPLLDAQNNIYGISGIATDITDRVIYQQQLIEARQMAEDAKSMQEQFLANMSHEIRTPMNGIQGMTDLLLETPLNHEQKDFAKTIKRSSDNLLVIINDILDFSKIKAGKLTIENIDFDLEEVLSNVKATFKHRIIEKGIGLTFNVAPDVPAILNGDPYRLNQILVNLISNAIKFTSKGSVELHVSVVKNISDITLHFAVTDTGIGIEPEQINQVFESFTQASVETTRKYGGTGLGLAITKQLLELQGGNIEVTSIPNQGTTFTFSLPCNYRKTDSLPLFAGKNIIKYSGLLDGRRFLVAEDNLVNQKVICHVLRKAGGMVDVANDGLEAIAFLNESKTYNLIIMDLQMPKMDGYAATKYIRNVMNISTPIIAMTASALNGQKELCLEIGMNDYVSKPFDFANIYKRICLLMDENSEPAEPVINKDIPTELLFDLSTLRELDDEEYICEVLNIFLSNTRIDINEIKKAAARGSFDRITNLAHKLKSSTGLLKITQMSLILKEIEDKAGKVENDVIVDMVHQLELEFQKVEPLIREHLIEMPAQSLVHI